jgi:hypothetical protein
MTLNTNSIWGNIVGGCATLIMGKVGYLKLQVIIFLTMQTVFVAALSGVVPYNRAGWSTMQFFAVGPFALITLLCYVIASLNVPLRHLGLASGLIGTFRSGGGAVGNAVFTTILNGVKGSEVPRRVGEVALRNAVSVEALIVAATENSLGIPGAFTTVPGITPAIEEAAVIAFREAYAYAFQRVFWASIPFGVIAVACACFIEDPSRYLTNHTVKQPHSSSNINVSNRSRPYIWKGRACLGKTTHITRLSFGLTRACLRRRKPSDSSMALGTESKAGSRIMESMIVDDGDIRICRGGSQGCRRPIDQEADLTSSCSVQDADSCCSLCWS